MGVRFFFIFLLQHFSLFFLFMLSAFGYGSALVSFIYRKPARPGLFVLLSLASGLGVLAHLTLLVGAVGLYIPAAAWGLVGLGVVLALLRLYRSRESFFRITWKFRSLSFFSAGLGIFIAIMWLYPLFANALIPPNSWDEVAYHLGIPQIYLANQAVVYIPYIPYANWPLEAEMWFVLALLMSSETLAHLITWGTMVLVCWSLALSGKHLFGKWEIGLLAAAIFSVAPMVKGIAGTGLIELPLTLFTCLAFFCFLLWLQTHERQDLILSALFGGLAASTKLNGAMIPLLLGVFVLYENIRLHGIRQSKSLRDFVVYGLVAFSVVAPWYIKSWVLAGNPVWPFLWNILGARDWDALGSEYLFGFIRLPNMPITLRNYLLGFWELTFHFGRFGPGSFSLGKVYFYLIPVGILAALRRNSPCLKEIRWLAFLSWVLYTNWFFQTHQSRFFMPATPVLALWLAASIVYLLMLLPRPGYLLAQAALLLVTFSYAWVFNPGERAAVIQNLPYLRGREDRETFLVRRITGYRAFQYANENLPEDAYVLLALYEVRGYYLDREYFWANPIDQRALKIETFSNSAELGKELRSRGFTHILYNSVKIGQYEYIRYGPRLTELMRQFIQTETRLLYKSDELELYEILP